MLEITVMVSHIPLDLYSVRVHFNHRVGLTRVGVIIRNDHIKEVYVWGHRMLVIIACITSVIMLIQSSISDLCCIRYVIQ